MSCAFCGLPASVDLSLLRFPYFILFYFYFIYLLLHSHICLNRIYCFI